MNEYNAKQYIELFHLLFLDQLSRKLDKKLYALKGGANLRFYFKSIRYSEDVDLDVKIISKETLRNKINGILQSLPFQQILAARRITIFKINAVKQTTTTQRWKLMLQLPSTTLPVNTKIEFSCHNLDFNNDVEFAVIDPAILQAYQLAPIMLNHYSARAACVQKIAALANRNQTQARDIFDIYLLLTSHIKQIDLSKETCTYYIKAQEQLSHLSFSDYESQVVSYLSVDYQKHYGTKKIWQDIVTKVRQFMENSCAPR